LLLPWRFFRLWSLASGIDPPEHMVRCMANNYSMTGFWRGWHRSYNLWIVYIYIPPSGMNNVAAPTLLILTSVALWHELSLTRMGLCRCMDDIGGIGAVFNILMMMTANLVGFVIGTEGVLYSSRQITGSLEGFRLIVTGCCRLFVGVQLISEYREEKRMSIFLQC
ncbi:glycerol uptake protein 1, partial [Pisolithus thermaeus]